jgi:PPOX class probable FMN-dependent enzyme
VVIEDDRTLVIPDRKGNNKIDTLRNVSALEHVGLMFMIPGIDEVLRIRGQATISADPERCAGHAVGGAVPKSLLIVKITAIFPHCGKAFIRSKLWDEDARRDRKRDGVPSLAQMALAMADMDDLSADEVDAKIRQDYKTSLY